MLDLIIVVILAIGIYEGFKEGLFIGLLSIVAFVFALILAFHLMNWGAEFLSKRVDEMTFMLPFVAFILIFFGVILIIRGLAFLVKQSLDFTILGSMDNVAGGILGFFKSVFLLSLFIWIAGSFEYSVPKDWIRDSKIYSYVEPIAPVTIDALDGYTPIIKKTVIAFQEIVKKTADDLID
ncbi:CvpA family protein [Cognataquiflexum rubidum]|uniref:CvpA family protein n=1 Tax=Cognataquiflexum rubidum TaxID=2922273 RepID=UPI001F136D2F|nr:CvpA family protein [Cognataquiflexum rubidum]MCH6236141.1 CvpA family protein [Cognataquiflexum rubidum]